MTKREKNPIAVALGRNGGKKTLKKYGKEYFKKLSKKAVKARKKKHIHKNHNQPLDKLK